MVTSIQWAGDGLGAGPLLLTSAGAGDTPPGFITGTTPQIELVDRRSPAIRFEASDNSPNYVGWQYAAVDLYAYTTRIYYYPIGFPSSGLLALFQHTNAGETLASNWIAIGANQCLQLLDKNGVPQAEMLTPLTDTTWHRIELAVNGGVHRLSLWVGEAAEPTEQIVELLAAPVAGGRLRLWNSFGNQSGVAGYIDDLAVTDEYAEIGAVSIDYSGYYCTPQDIREVLAGDPRLTTDPQTAASLDDASLLQAIRDASSEIDAYLGGRYTTPVARVDGIGPGGAAAYPPVIIWLATNNAAWYATLTWRKSKDMGSEDPVQKRRAAVRHIFEGVQKGEIDLPLPGISTTGGDAINLWEGSLFDHRDWLPGEPWYRGGEPMSTLPTWWDPAWGVYPA